MKILHTGLDDGDENDPRKPHPKGGGDPEADAGKEELTKPGSDIWHTKGSDPHMFAESVFMASFVVTSATAAAIMTGWAENHTSRVSIMKYLVVSMPNGLSTKIATDLVQTLLPDSMQRPSHTAFAIAFALYFFTTVLYSWRQHEGTCQGQIIAIAIIVTIGLSLKMGLPLQSIVLSLGPWILIFALLVSRVLDVVVWRYQ